ncbi:MAG: HalD/BesD family halogenase, partial [Acidimicrobiales bacterium]
MIDDLLDLERYPIDRPETDAFGQLVASCRAQLEEQGASEMPGFVTDAGLAVMVADALEREPDAFRSSGVGTAYLELPDESWPEDHPRRSWGEYAVGAVAYDLFPATSPLRQLYEWPPLRAFLADVLEHGEVHPYADPLGALNLATMGA